MCVRLIGCGLALTFSLCFTDSLDGARDVPVLVDDLAEFEPLTDLFVTVFRLHGNFFVGPWIGNCRADTWQTRSR